MKSYFSKVLSELMDKHNLSQLKLSKILQIRQSTIHGWLIDNRKPSYDNLKSLSDYFCVSADFLLDTKFKSHSR